MSRFLRAALIATAFLALAPWAAAAQTASQVPPAPDEVHGYVLLAPSAEGTVALARVVVAAGRDCPALLLDDGSSVATVARKNPHPATFPIEVCEARYPFGQRGRVDGTELRLPAVTLPPSRLTVVGDTGCEDGTWQPCDTTASWPFAALADAAAKTAPALVIHVGDYNYRGTPGEVTIDGVTKPVYDAGDNAGGPGCRSPDGYVSQNVSGSTSFDNWTDWRRDFFVPARPLLLAAPWVFTRGNHELCSRAGPGWFYLLDPASPLLGGGAAQRSCPDQTGTEPLLFTPPYGLDLGTLGLAMVDSANACDQAANFPETYTRQLARVGRLTPDRPSWLVTHRPLWGMREAPQKQGPSKSEVINQTLQQALRAQPGGKLPAKFALVLSGHMHRFEAVSFGADRVPELIIGNSGGSLATDPPDGSFTATIDGLPATGVSRDEFGFMEVVLGLDGAWQGEVVNPLLANELIATCGTSEMGLCVLTAD